MKSEKLIKFEKIAALFLEYETDFNGMPQDHRSSLVIELQKEEFKDLWGKVKEAYEAFITTQPTTDSSEECDQAKELYKESRLAYITIAAQMGELSQSLVNKSVMSSLQCGSESGETPVVDHTSIHHLKLPACTVEPFKGDYRSWPSFRDMFTAVYINCEGLSGVEKLFYLRQFTSDEALEIVKNSPLTNQGFHNAWSNLIEAYENNRILVNSQLKILFNLVPVKSESAKDIKRLQRDINNAISVLNLHEIDIATWDPIFVYLCSINLPVLTLSLWEQGVKNKKEIPKWRELDNFLTSRFQSLETVFDIRNFSQSNVSTRTDWKEPDRSVGGKPRENSEFKSANRTFSSSNGRVRTFQARVSRRTCVLCSKDRLLRFCAKFLEMNPGERFLVVKRHNLCINCLSEGHKLESCGSKYSCSSCNLKHNSMLHREIPVVAASDNDQEQAGPSQSAIIRQTVQNCFAVATQQVLLGTAIVNIVCKGEVFSARALIDSGSQATFISEKLQRMLDLPTNSTTATVSGLNGALAGSVHKQCSFVLSSPRDTSFNLEVQGLVLPKLTGRLPAESVDMSKFSTSGLILADPNFAKSSQVDILIGGDNYPKVMLDGVRKNIYANLMAQETHFGWILTGPLPSLNQEACSTKVSYFTDVSLDKQLEKFWILEEPPQHTRATPEHEYCEEQFRKTVKRTPKGRYVVSLPFKPQYITDKGLGHSRDKARRQFLRNEISLGRNPDLKLIYDNVLSEYEVLNHMSEVKSVELKLTDAFYLPHHAVFKPESTSTKVRVVFNASSRTSSGLSLNDVLYSGPILQNDLTLLILRWRFYKYVFNGDIEKMYRQILINPDETKFQRIIFRRNSHEDLKDFELKTVTFGVNCAPFLAIRTLLQLAEDIEDKWPLASKVLRHMMYVDDALVGAHDVSLAISARNQLILALSSAGFSMRKWTSNDERILQDLPTEHLLNENFKEITDDSVAKTLGIRWNAKLDKFYFTTSQIDMKEHFTKRDVLSSIAKLFDPAGWLGPIVIIAKMLMQQIWSEGTGWDEIISKGSETKWKQFLLDFSSINDIQITRWIGFGPSKKLEIHGFCDASEKAYGACIYVRVQEGDGTVQSHLLVAKSRVAPLKTVSLPRLELCGALLLSDLLETIRKNLNFDQNQTKFFTWSDSTIVLAWLQKPPSSWTTFVANRVSKIIAKTGKESWRHVSSGDNPADLISRGVRSQDLIGNQLWWNGPSWLRFSSNYWSSPTCKDFGTREEERVQKAFFAYFESYDDLLQNFSSYSRALRVMAYVFRGINAFRKINRLPFASLEISSEELRCVKNRLIIVAQKVHFSDEYFHLSSKKSLGNSKLLNLNPFLDENGIMRLGGRLANAPNLTYNEKLPILMSSNSYFAKLLVKFIHGITLHGGNQLMLRVLRTEFFIPRAKNLIKTIIGRCRTCTIQKKTIRSQLMGALPIARTIISRPFASTGVDFTGPFDIRSFTGRACKITKGYVCVFVCFSTKAIHLEAVSSLSTSAFLAAFGRFVSRRGCPKDMYSDNGTNFVGASKVLRAEFRSFLRDIGSEVNSIYALQGINWHFNPASAPHMGGLWESGVKSFKHHFRRIAGGLKYTFEEFATLLARIESCLNSRPLCPLTDNVECLDCLTPGHFLIGGPLLASPEVEIQEAPIAIVNRWQRVKALNQRLYSRWKDEYLKDLQKRNKWKNLQKDLQVGDMVVIKEDHLPTNEWRLGRVEKLYIGKDGHVRVVGLKTARGSIIRPVVKLVVLPTS